MPINPAFVTELTESDLGGVGQVESHHIHTLGPSDSLQAMARYQRYLEQKLSADQSTWHAAYRGEYGREFWQTQLMDGWKVMDVSTPLCVSYDVKNEKELYFQSAKTEGLDPQAAHTIRHAGKTRVHTIDQAIDAKEWETHWMRARLASQGCGERLVGVHNLGENCESVFLVDRQVGAERFNEDDVATFYTALMDFPRWHYWWMLERGLAAPATKPFTPKERLVVQALLTPASEEAIAKRLELSRGVLHNYITAIYRNMKVNSRYELLQAWLVCL